MQNATIYGIYIKALTGISIKSPKSLCYGPIEPLIIELIEIDNSPTDIPITTKIYIIKGTQNPQSSLI